MHWETILIFIGAFGFGALHAFEIDHLAAVSAFVARKPAPGQAVLFGIKWAVGHGLSLLFLGSLLYLLKLSVAVSLAGSLERLVGVALFGLGVWTLLQLRPGQMHHSHSHTHTAEGGRTLTHTHRDGSLLMGMLHGAAGTAAFVGQTLVAFSQSFVSVLAYTTAFSIGVLVAMAVYAGMLGGMLHRGRQRSLIFAKGAQALAGIWACGVGILWVLG
jgi:hypothetical protein